MLFRSAVAMVGIMTGVFNWLLALAGYIKPEAFTSLTEAAGYLTPNGLTSQVALESITASEGVYTVAMAQPDIVYQVITFAFVGLEVFTGLILALILRFLDMEKNITREQEEIKARKEKEV